MAIALISAHDMIPILGGRTKEQLDESLAASDVKLSADQLKGWMKSAPSRLGSRATLWPENLFDRGWWVESWVRSSCRQQPLPDRFAHSRSRLSSCSYH
jgi:hypothetical protein